MAGGKDQYGNYTSGGDGQNRYTDGPYAGGVVGDPWLQYRLGIGAGYEQSTPGGGSSSYVGDGTNPTTNPEPTPAPVVQAPDPVSQPSYNAQPAAVSMPSNATRFQAPNIPQASANFSSPLDGAYRDAIMKLLNTPQDVDPATLAKTPENRSYRLAAQRAEERQTAQLAEQAAGQGWSGSGGFETQRQGIRQARGEGEAAFLGQLATTIMERNRQSLIQGIQFAISDGQFDKAQQMQAQLANLDAMMQQARLAEQGREFDLGLGFDYTQLGVNANQAAANAALGF
jgi:hypothetical protein